MEPWQQEALLQQRYARHPGKLCQCCDAPVETERYLDLSAFGLAGVVCERCVCLHYRYTDQ